jgi:AraC-like DNA-binding protein
MHTIKHHVHGIKMVLAMMPRLGIVVPEELLNHPVPQLAASNEAFKLHQELHFFDRLIDLIGDPLIGLRLAKAYPPQAYGIYGLTQLVAPDLRAIFELSPEHGRLSYTLMKQSVEFGKKNVFCRLTPSNLKLSQKLQTFYADRDIGAAVYALNSIARKNLNFDHIALMHDGQGRKQDYIDHFGCDVKFNAASNYYALPIEVIDEPLPFSQPETFQLCRAQSTLQFSKLTGEDDLVNHVRQEFQKLPGYLHDFPSIAAELNMTERTLRRRLAKLGTSYNDIQQEIRFEASKEYLLNSSLLLKEIAELIGYNDAATFCYAFKQWSGGLSPRQFTLQNGNQNNTDDN